MTGNGIFKRFVPFLLTLMAGVFIASIFIDVSSPFGYRARRAQCWNEVKQLRIENQQLRSEREQLRNENAFLRRNSELRRLGTVENFDSVIAPVPAPMDAPRPPPAIRTAPHGYVK